MDRLERQPRSDARRNRERVIETARAAFVAGETAISFDELGKRAGVGAGTLYRHFPDRVALIAAVYRDEVERLAEAATTLAGERTPVEALRAWMLLFVDYIATKKLAASALNPAIEANADVTAGSADTIRRAIRGLATQAVEAGELRADVEPLDLLRALIGVSNVAASPDWHNSARRLVDILIAGSSPRAADPP